MRLNQYVAHAGICSRRKADELILQGKIQINGKIADHPSIRVQPDDNIRYLGKILTPQKKLYLLFNKPLNCITTLHDPQKRTTIKNYLPKNLPRIYPIGRLDRNTTGVLLMTNDGHLARALAHPSQNVDKTYHVTLKNKLSLADLTKIQQGLSLEDGIAMIDSIHSLNKECKKFVIHLHSGKNRIIRRIFQALSHQILMLERIAYADITLKDLPLGKWRHLTQKEIDMLIQRTSQKEYEQKRKK